MSEERKILSDEDIKTNILQQHQAQTIKNDGLPTETIELPSKGWFYPEGSPLSKGIVELKYPTASDEDVLTSKNLRKQKTALDRFLQGLIVTPGVHLNDFLATDVFALMVGARVLAYGKEYTIELTDPEHPIEKEKVTIDLTSLEEIPQNFIESERNKNEFEFTLPKSKWNVKYKFLNYKEDKELGTRTETVIGVRNQVEGLVTETLSKQIIEINGERSPEKISMIVKTMLSQDSRALRLHIESKKTGLNTKILYVSKITGNEHEIDLPLTQEFFWPTTGIEN